MPRTYFLPCSNGSHGVRRAFFGVFSSSSWLHTIRYCQRWPSDIAYERFELDFAVFRSKGTSFALSEPKMMQRPKGLPARSIAGASALQNTPFFARAGTGYLRRTWRLSINICNLYRELCKPKRRAVWVGVSGCLAHQNGELPYAPYTLSECKNGLTRCQA